MRKTWIVLDLPGCLFHNRWTAVHRVGGWPTGTDTLQVSHCRWKTEKCEPLTKTTPIEVFWHSTTEWRGSMTNKNFTTILWQTNFDKHQRGTSRGLHDERAPSPPILRSQFRIQEEACLGWENALWLQVTFLLLLIDRCTSSCWSTPARIPSLPRFRKQQL